MSRFRLELAGGPALQQYQRRTGNLDALLPPARDVVAQEAASRWLAHAYNEHHSATLMAHVVQLLTAAQTPIDLAALACSFPAQELVHADLCGRLALALSPRPALRAVPQVMPDYDKETTPRQRADEAVIRLLCVSEGISFAWLRAMRKRARHPGAVAVVKRVLRDEALHARFGWMYLDWSTRTASAHDRARMRHVTKDAITGYASILQPARATAQPELAEYGLLDTPAQARAAREAVANELLPELARVGLA